MISSERLAPFRADGEFRSRRGTGTAGLKVDLVVRHWNSPFARERFRLLC